MIGLQYLTDATQALAEYGSSNAKIAEELGRINVLIAGNSGVGKSTVINSIFGRAVAQTGVGSPQTMHIEAFEPPDSPLRIYDTRGFEIAKAEETVSAVQNKVLALRAQTDPQKQIHVAWTCILEQSHRIEPVQTKLLQMLDANNVPAIVLITQAFEGNPDMEASVRRLAVPNRGVVPILAEPKNISGFELPARGIDELIDATLRLLPDAQKNAFIAAQNARWDLKEKAITDRINSAALAAATSALVPVPGGHSVTLLSIQMGMLAWINSYLGLSLGTTGGKDVVKGLVGIVVTKAAGQTAFWLVLTEAMKLFPGIGTLGAAAVGGPIGAALTKTLGHVYFDTVKDYARSDAPLPSPEELGQRMERMLAQNKAHYQKLAKNVA